MVNVEAVKELHKKVNGPYDNSVCDHCSELVMLAIEDNTAPAVIEYPCPTITLLEGNNVTTE